MFVTNWISTTKIQKISEITNFFRHYFLSRTEVEIYPTAHDRRGNDGMLSRNDVFPHRHRRAHHLPALGHSAYPQHPEEDASLELCGKKNEEKSCIIQRFMLTLQTKKS